MIQNGHQLSANLQRRHTPHSKRWRDFSSQEIHRGAEAKKRCSFRWLGELLGLLLFLVLLCPAAFADTTNITAGDFFNQVLTNLCDPAKPFAAVAQVDNSSTKLSAGVCCQDGNYRIYVDMGNISALDGDPLAARVAQARKAQGLSRLVSLFRKGDPNHYVIFPDRRAYHTDTGVSGLLSTGTTNLPTVQCVEGMPEQIEGHPCRKIQLTVESPTNVLVTAWRAKDLGDRPLQLRFGSMTIHFTQIRTNRTDAKLFEVPAGVRKFDGIESLAAEAIRQPVMR